MFFFSVYAPSGGHAAKSKRTVVTLSIGREGKSELHGRGSDANKDLSVHLVYFALLGSGMEHLLTGYQLPFQRTLGNGDTEECYGDEDEVGQLPLKWKQKAIFMHTKRRYPQIAVATRTAQGFNRCHHTVCWQCHWAEQPSRSNHTAPSADCPNCKSSNVWRYPQSCEPSQRQCCGTNLVVIRTIKHHQIRLASGQLLHGRTITVKGCSKCGQEYDPCWWHDSKVHLYYHNSLRTYEFLLFYRLDCPQSWNKVGASLVCTHRLP